MEDRDVAPPRGRIRERPDILAQVVVDREREEIRLMSAAPQHVAHDTRAVADRIAAVRRRDPLVDDHCRRGPELVGIRDPGSGIRTILEILVRPAVIVELSGVRFRITDPDRRICRSSSATPTVVPIPDR